MKRVDFLKGSLITGLSGLLGLKKGSGSSTSSTYDRLMDQVGFNHIQNKELITMNTVLHKANTRGHANHGWLDSKHSFSFANYYNPERMHFGVLRVLNDDSVAPGRGFGKHPHDNMEIISIPLSGDLEHKDSMGNVAVIKAGEIQVMSAGTGITHSEFNRKKDEDVKFLQIWIFPRTKQVEPRYDQITIKDLAKENEFYQILSPEVSDAGVWIHQDAWFHMGDFDADKSTCYEIKKAGNGVYAFVLEGSVEIEGQKLGPRDGYGIWNVDSFDFKSTTDSKVLLMEVPMELG